MGMREVVADGTPALGSAEWVAAFLLSPGVAGLAAVLAAVLALVAARARIRADATTSREERSAVESAEVRARAGQEQDRDPASWWDTYRWAVERGDRCGHERLAPVVGALRATAQGPVPRALAQVASSEGPDHEQERDHERPG